MAQFAGPHRRCSSARFISDLAAVSSILTTVACDILFLAFSKQSPAEIQRRYGLALQAMELLHDIISMPESSVWISLPESLFGYSQAQIDSSISFFGDLVGVNALFSVEPDDVGHRRVSDRRPRVPEEAPFMIQLLFYSFLNDCLYSLFQIAWQRLASVLVQRPTHVLSRATSVGRGR